MTPAGPGGGPDTLPVAQLRLLVAEHERRSMARALESVFLSGLEARTRLLVARHEQAGLASSMAAMREALHDVDAAYRDIRGSRTFRGWASLVGYERRRLRRAADDDGRSGR